MKMEELKKKKKSRSKIKLLRNNRKLDKLLERGG